MRMVLIWSFQQSCYHVCSKILNSTYISETIQQILIELCLLDLSREEHFVLVFQTI